MSNRLILPVMIIFVLMGAVSIAFAQQNLPNDTIKVVDSFGRPGDTIQVNVYISNTTILLGGYSAVVFFDPNKLEVIDISCLDRGCTGFEATAGMVHRDSLFVFAGYSLHPNVYLPRGQGMVAQMRVRIKPGDQFNDVTYIRFGDDPNNEFFNVWADTTGSGIQYYPRQVSATITVTGGSGNLAPVITNVGPQEVREGQNLQFTVSAYDLDGDNLTLSASNLPANASFPTVQGDSTANGIFSFTPSFGQGPDTFFVVFSAADDHNNTTRLTVPIIVLATPHDYIIVDPTQGGVPGAQGRDVDVDLTNAHNIYGVQFNYYYNPQMIDVVDVVPTDRCLGLGFWYNEPTPGSIVVLIFSPGLDPILPGDGTIVRFVTDVSTSALFGPTPVNLDSAIEVIDSIGTSRYLITTNGFFTVDRFGDANLDGHVDVGDCITLVAYIVEQYVLSVRQFDAADINRDTRVNVSDLQTIIDQILRIPTSPGPISPTPLVSVELKRDVPLDGDIISIPIIADVGTEAAAVQYELNYDVDKLEPINVVSGQMVQNLQLDHKESDGVAKGVFYNLAGSTFGPASGELATFNFRLKNGEFSPRDINFREFLIVNRGAGFIPSEIKGELPTQYSLDQNYPNPFNSSTKISFDLYEDAQVELTIYDLLGRKVATLVNQFMPVGNHSVIWDGRSDNGENMASGVFFYRLQAGSFDQTKRMLLMK